MNDDQDDQDGGVTLSPDDLRALRDKAKEADRLAKDHEVLQRKMAFVEAKIDVTDPKLKYFVEGYKGEMTPDAIRAEAKAAGFIDAAPPATQVPQGELDAHQKVGAAAAGGDAGEPFDFQAELAKCRTPEEVMALASRQNMPTVWNRPS